MNSCEMPVLTFLIPVRHQDNARDWGALKSNLEQTILSISNQTNPNWQAIIIANEGAALPTLPKMFKTTWVTFPPNPMHEKDSADREKFLDTFRLDKGRRVLAGMLDTHGSQFFMVVDDDDFVSNRIVQYVSENTQCNGWVIDKGYIWDSGGKILLKHDSFNEICGTSLIIRADNYQLPKRLEDASTEWIKIMLGSHRHIVKILTDRGMPPIELPFRGAIYRVAHSGSHSRTPSLVWRYFMSLHALRHPLRWLSNLFKLRWLNTARKMEFFGSS